MNRPKYEDFVFPKCETPLESWYSYAFELERYCDELEISDASKEECAIRQHGEIKALEKRCSVLEKALEKICEVLSIVSKDYCIGRLCFKSCDIDCGECPTQEELKGHFIKEVQDE